MKFEHTIVLLLLYLPILNYSGFDGRAHRSENAASRNKTKINKTILQISSLNFIITYPDVPNTLTTL